MTEVDLSAAAKTEATATATAETPELAVPQVSGYSRGRVGQAIAVALRQSTATTFFRYSAVPLLSEIVTIVLLKVDLM